MAKTPGGYQLLNPPEADIFKIKKFALTIEDDYLVQKITDSENKTFTQILRPVNASEAIIDGYGRGLGETMRVLGDGELLTFWGLRLRRIEPWRPSR